MDYEKEISHYELRVGNRIEKFSNYIKLKQKYKEYIQSRSSHFKISAFAIFNDDTFMEVLKGEDLSLF